ncbi:protein shisa-5 [Aplysia californica]|uniref:Protein shisa-5 n=1 Tax=Aplysia californica TaxID=6500 RepID=A0ABM0K217_APLCA|nr:protein shisa-5 [Aplysia californica]
MAGSFLLLVLLCVFYFLTGCEAEYCGNYDSLKYCTYGCCNEYFHDCCDPPVGMIIGIIGAVGFCIFVIALIVCLCRRRRLQGQVIYGQQPGAAVVVAQSNNTTMNTTGMQPGVAYPQYPAAYPGYPQYPAQPAACPYPAHQPQPAFAQGPPAYQDVPGQNAAPQYAQGKENHGYDGAL